MNRISLATFASIFAMTLLVMTPVRSRAQEDDGHEGAHHQASSSSPKGSQPVTARTLGGLWHDIEDQRGELRHLLKTQELDHVHKAAYALRDLVAAMPEKSGTLPADKLTQLKANVKYVATLAQRLDAAGDAKDQAGSEAAFKQLESVLTKIAALYPPADLK